MVPLLCRRYCYCYTGQVVVVSVFLTCSPFSRSAIIDILVVAFLVWLWLEFGLEIFIIMSSHYLSLHCLFSQYSFMICIVLCILPVCLCI